MITQTVLKQLATKYQTGEFPNIVREYFQHLFLSRLSQHESSENFLFKGGTALRILYGSPRFSEDLDFSLFGIVEKNKKIFIENCFAKILLEIEQTGVEVKLGSKSNTTTGGYYGEALFTIYDYPPVTVSINISSRISSRPSRSEAKQLMRLKGATIRSNISGRGEVDLITNEFIPTYHLFHLPQEELISEKIFGRPSRSEAKQLMRQNGAILALLERKKARDFYDLYFIMRHRLLSPEHKKRLKRKSKAILEISAGIDFKTELGVFLPKDQQIIIKNFPDTLARELRNQLG